MALNPNSSIPAMLRARVKAHAAEIVLRKKDRGIWKAVTWAELGTRVAEAAMWLRAIGLRPGDVACVLAETRPEWVAIDLAILECGGISGGIDPADDAATVGRRLRAAGATTLFVQNEEQLDKALMVRDACPALQRIVILDMHGLRDFADARCEGFQEFLVNGGQPGPHADAAVVEADQAAVLLFPPATGDKGTTLTHAAVLRLVQDAVATLGLRAADERLAILPMSDVMERIFGLYVALYSGAISNYMESPNTVIENLREVKPSILGTDSPFWERLHEQTNQSVKRATSVQRLLYGWALRASQLGGVLAGLARLTVLRAVRRDLGFSRLRLAYVDAAVTPEVQRWAAALGISIRSIDSRTAAGTATNAGMNARSEKAYTT